MPIILANRIVGISFSRTALAFYVIYDNRVGDIEGE